MEVKLYVYDLSRGMMKEMSKQFLGKQFDGIWHTAIVVYGKEFYFGGGINSQIPGTTPFGTPTTVHPLGTTEIPQEIFFDFLDEIREKYNANTYDLLNNNCNNFSNEAAQFLTGKSIPSYITSLPSDFLNTPLGGFIKPMLEQFTNTTAMQNHDYRNDVSNTQQAIEVHPHQRLLLPTLAYSNPNLFTTHGNPAKLFAKLNEFIELAEKEQQQKPLLTEGESICLESLHRLLSDSLSATSSISSSASNNSAFSFPLPTGTIELVEKLFKTLPDAKIFPCLDILRLILLNPTANMHFTAVSNTFLDEHVIQRFAASEKASKACKWLSLQVICNSFATACGANFMITKGRLDSIIDCFTASLDSSHGPTAKTAAAIAYNCTLFIPRDDSDLILIFLSAIVYRLNNSFDSTTSETAFNLLMALGKLLWRNDEAVTNTEVLELNLAPLLEPKFPSAKVKKAAQEVTLMLNAK